MTRSAVVLGCVLPLVAVLSADAMAQRIGASAAERDPRDGGGLAVSSAAALARLKSDLRNLASVQETYFANFGRYAASFEELRRYFTPSPDVRIRIQMVGSDAWAATAHLTRLGFGQACLLKVGTSDRDDGTLICRSVTEIEAMWGMLVRRTTAKPVDSAESVASPLPKGFQIMTAPVDIPDVIPEFDLSKKLTKEADFSGRGVEEGVAACSWEKPVAPIPGTGSPRYPDILLSAGVEGQVLAQFVVDTLGRVASDSFKVIRSDHELFSAAVRGAIPAMRFLPAECDGRKVKQLIQQPFDFNRRR